MPPRVAKQKNKKSKAKQKTSINPNQSEPKKSSRTAKITSSTNPDHSLVLGRLNKIKGQLEGIERMISERRYCVDILTQLRASSSALRSIEGVILQKHLRNCVQDALLLKDQNQIELKIEEMVKLSVRS